MQQLNRFIQSRTGLWIFFIAWSLFASSLWLPRNWGFYGSGDWDLTYSTFEIARMQIVDYGIWPSYQPFLAYGSDLNANPQAVHASIFFLPVLLFGTFYGYKLSILMAMLFGLWGMFRLSMKLSGNFYLSLAMSVIFCGASYFSRHIFEAGHSNFLYLYLLPYFVFHLHAYTESRRMSGYLLSVLILAQTIAGGAPMMFIMMAGMMLLWGIGLVWINKRSPFLFMHFVIIVLFSLGLNAWKLIPVFEFWEQHARIASDTSGINLLIWLQALGDYSTDSRTPHAWHEISIGFPIVLLAITVFYIRNLKDHRKWLLLFVPLFWLSLGNIPEHFNPWYLMNQYLPVFDGLRAPYRLSVIVLLLFSIGFILVYKDYQNKLIYIVLFAVSLSQTLSYNAISRQQAFGERLEDIKIENADPLNVKVLSPKEKGHQYLFLKNKTFIPNAYEPQILEPVTDTLGSFVSGAELVDFRPDRIKLNAETGDVRLMLRFDQFWTADGSTLIYDDHGLLGLKNAEGEIELSYNNAHQDIASLISLIVAMVFLIYLWFYFKFKPELLLYSKSREIH